MVDRRTFMSWIAGAAAIPKLASVQTSSNKVALYASVGAELTQYDVDVEGAALVKRGTVTLPANVQYGWPHASRRYLYVASSNSAPGSGPVGNMHHASSFRIDPASGALTPHGKPISLPSRPIHMSTDIPSEHALIAYNNPSSLTVHRINRDGTLGQVVKQPGALDAGIYAHQIRVTLNNKVAMLATRGNDAAGGTPEDPGALKTFSYKDGMLTKEGSVAPGGGYGFRPRRGVLRTPSTSTTRSSVTVRGRHHLIGEKSVGFTNIDSTFPTSGPLISDRSRISFQPGSLRKSSQDFLAASRLSCERT